MTRHIPLEVKESIVKQGLSRGGKSLAVIAAENKVGYSTLQKWMRNTRAGISLSNKAKTVGQNHRADEQLVHLLATANLDETAVSVYCREQGIYSHQLTNWKETIMAESSSKKHDQQSRELRLLKQENKALKKDLRRKDRALAETSALLILKKKADLIWGESEDD